MSKADKDSPRKDHNGRDLWEVVLSDGWSWNGKVKVYYYAYDSRSAVEYAQGEHGMPWKSVSKVTDQDNFEG